MSTFYSLNSVCWVPRVREPEVRERIEDIAPVADVVIEVAADDAAQIRVLLYVADTMSYSTATNLDSDWTEFVREFADFKRGPVECISGGDEYNETGLQTWLIGPRSVILRQLIQAQEKIIVAAEKRRSRLRKLLAAKNVKLQNKIISTQDKEPG